MGMRLRVIRWMRLGGRLSLWPMSGLGRMGTLSTRLSRRWGLGRWWGLGRGVGLFGLRWGIGWWLGLWLASLGMRRGCGGLGGGWRIMGLSRMLRLLWRRRIMLGGGIRSWMRLFGWL